MSRGTEQKRIHYVRAVYSAGTKPKKNFELLVKAALAKLATVTDTEFKLPSSEVMAVRDRDTSGKYLKLAIGLGVPDEAMATLGVGVKKPKDDDKPQAAVTGRAYKLQDAFCLVDEDELLVCLDGGMRLRKVETYLRGLLSISGASPDAQAFELIARTDQAKATTVALEGVKAFRVRGSAYIASKTAIGPGTGPIKKGWDNLISAVRTAFEAEVKTAAERAALASHWADVNVDATFSVKGGANGEPIVLQTMEEAAIDLQDDAPPGAQVTLITRKNNEIDVDLLTMRTIRSIKRLSSQNALDHYDAWEKLEIYRDELAGSKRWKT